MINSGGCDREGTEGVKAGGWAVPRGLSEEEAALIREASSLWQGWVVGRGSHADRKPPEMRENLAYSMD